VSLDATPPPPRHRSETERVGYVPSLRPIDPSAQRAVLVVVFAPLAVLIALLVIVHVATSSANPGGGGGNYGAGPYAGAQTTSADGQNQDTYSPPDDEYTAPDPGDTATDDDGYGDTAGPTVSPSSPTPSPDATDPGSVVEAYFAAINDQDYQTAWNLGGENQGGSYSAFQAGFADTEQDTVTVDSVSGDVVTASLVAQNDDGTVQNFSGTYTVANGVITDFSVQQTG
jgi:hypothetical protein